MTRADRFLQRYGLWLVAAMAIVSRLPQLVSPHLFLDGDECIMGLMAKHFFEGKSFPIFFYGQSYGFSLLEVLFISLGYLFFGFSPVAVKCAMLLLWTFGVVLFYLALRNQSSDRHNLLVFLIIVILILHPAFAVWSMKARGGYLTAFTLSALCVYMLAKLTKATFLTWLILGFCMVLIYQAQALWLAGIAPIFIYHLWKVKSPKALSSSAIGMVLGISVFLIIKVFSDDFWSPMVLHVSHFNIETLISLPQQMIDNFSGSYLYSEVQSMSSTTSSLAFGTMIWTFVLLGFGLFGARHTSSFEPQFFVGCISILLTLSYLLFMAGNSPRYLLPLLGWVVYTTYFLLLSIEKPTFVIAALGLVIFAAMSSVLSFSQFKNPQHHSEMKLIEQLRATGTSYAYCEDGLLQWKIMFYTNESVVARYKTKTDRYPEYIARIAAAPRSETVLVGHYAPSMEIDTSKLTIIEDRLFILEAPSDAYLTSRGFEL